MRTEKVFTALVAARMGSSRFPGKTLSDLHGLPMLTRLVDRIRFSNYIGEVVVATTDLPEDVAIEDWSKQNDADCFRGSPSDVLGRLTAAGEAFNCSDIVEILGDNPLVHSDLIDASIEKYISGEFDYVATLTNEYPNADRGMSRFPIGVRVQVMSLNTLQKCSELASEPRYREHATSFIAEHPEIFKTGFVEASGRFAYAERPKWTFAVNEKKNMALLEHIFSECFSNNPNFSLEDAMEVVNNNPEWRKMMGNS